MDKLRIFLIQFILLICCLHFSSPHRSKNSYDFFGYGSQNYNSNNRRNGRNRNNLNRRNGYNSGNGYYNRNNKNNGFGYFNFQSPKRRLQNGYNFFGFNRPRYPNFNYNYSFNPYNPISNNNNNNYNYYNYGGNNGINYDIGTTNYDYPVYPSGDYGAETVSNYNFP